MPFAAGSHTPRAAVVAAALASLADAALAATTCSSRPGGCAIVSSRSGPTWEEVVVQTNDAATRFHLELHRDDRTLVLDWRAPANGQFQNCTAPAGCEGAPPLACTDAVVCGRVSGTSYCGSFLSEDTIELRFLWCRTEEEPWPPWPAPLPPPHPNPPPPPPKKKPPVEDERREPPGDPKPPEESAWFFDKLKQANAADRPWQVDGRLTTRKGLPSSAIARHVPGLTWMSAGVGGEEPTEAYFAPGGRMVARRGTSGSWLELRPAPESDTASGGYEPPAPPVPQPILGPKSGKKKSGALSDFGPSALVAALDADSALYYGLETCGGSPLAGVLCHRVDFDDDGVPNSVYFGEDDLLLESIVGSDRNGPRKLVWRYDPAVAVLFPHDSQIRKLTGDPQRDMAAMMTILGPP